jgi:betaine-aldehyde dehydrogenase
VATVKEEVRTYQMFIAGEWVDSSSGETSEVIDPSTGEVVARVPRATTADAERAVQAARKAFDEGPWGKTTAEDRAKYLRRVANAIREHAEEWARLESRQMGKLFEDAVLDMNDCAHTFDYYAGLAVEQHGQTLEVPGESLSMVVREPVGVTVGITPWNYPILMAAWKLAPSLAAGNVMILKPATVSPITTLELARAFEEIGLPER